MIRFENDPAGEVLPTSDIEILRELRELVGRTVGPIAVNEADIDNPCIVRGWE